MTNDELQRLILEECPELVPDAVPDLCLPGSICQECAKRHDGEWPNGHVATFWYGTCSFCREQNVACCCVTDWNFPNTGRPDREF